MGTTIDNFAEIIVRELADYTQDIAEGVKEAVDETAKEMASNIKSDSPKRTGKYRRHMKLKIAYESNYEKRVVWYVSSPYSGLPHLLERGHTKRGGGRTRAFPHIAKNAEKAEKDFEKRVEKVIKNGGK